MVVGHDVMTERDGGRVRCKDGKEWGRARYKDGKGWGRARCKDGRGQNMVKRT